MPNSRQSIFLKPFLLCLSLLAYTACTQHIEKPSETIQTAQIKRKTWKEADTKQSSKISRAWLKEFSSPRMEKLVLEAIKNNPNLKAAEARLRASWATTHASRSDLEPSLNANTGTNKRRSGNLSNNASYSTTYNLSLNLSWEVDLWGRIRDRASAAQAEYQADVHDFRNAKLSLAANTARAWCNLITAEQQLELAKNTLASFKKNKQIVERNYKAGVPGTRSLAVQLSRTNVAQAESTLKNRQLQRNNAARSLEVLLGRYPSAELKSSTTLPQLKRHIPVGLPAQLLSRRPDVKAAELAVFASAKRADSARKSLLPAVRFNSNGSSSSSQFKDIFNIHNLVSNAAANLTQSVYNGGELKANAQAALERNKASIHSYANIVLQASREIEEAINTDRALREQEQFLKEQTKSATLAEKQAERDYSEGIEGVGILEILESQRRANNARSSLINLRNRRLQNRIDLHLALGGDFSTPLK